ncbi:E3 ubiquitin-protein ligase RNF180-like [Megalops cyprinoides]|uniref:E3 ubiquitin-protein ligase RNF180-like n=1 Tax=Megalops cyprinoides TaxID=118141 RepID=UPI001864C783|nr:E3 ubiquitin-protein ligase RNF180-like [Megalops cyprinoides]
MVLRCRRCRKCVLDAVWLVPINAADENTSECRIWHLDFDLLPAWILTAINQASWTVGKLNCQFCGARLGGFNFINRAKCPCGRELTVHLCRSRLDRDAGPALSVSQAASGPHSERGPGGPASKDPGSDPRPPSPAETSVSPEFGPGTEAACPEVRSHETHTGPADGGDPPAPPSPPQSVEVVGRKAGGLDRRAAGEASPSAGFCDEAAQSEAGRGQDCAPPPRPCGQTDLGSAQPESPHPAEGQRELGDWPGLLPVTPIQEEREELEEEREGWGAPVGSLSLAGPPVRPATELTLTKRERNRLKSQRRKQRKRERWLQSQLQEHSQQSLSGSVTGSEDEEVPEGEREGFTCAVCLDVYFSPHVCQPCQHVFCEPCLRTLAKNRPANTPCPLCRTLITHVVFHKELHHTAKTFFPKLYVTRKRSFQRAHCARWPLPSCKKVFHFFSGFRRRAGLGHRPLLLGEHRLDVLNLQDESEGWRLDLDVWIVYTHCANWVLGVAVCCFLCYLLLAWL